MAFDEYNELIEPSQEEPEEDDVFLSPTGRLGAQTSVSYAGKHLGVFNGDEEALAAVRAKMEADEFWPNIWMVSDHGNTHLVTD